MVLLNCTKLYKKRPIESIHGLVAFLFVGAEKKDGMREADIGVLRNRYMDILRPWYWKSKKRYR